MKILHVNLAISGGGIEQYLIQLFSELEKRGHDSIFLYGEDSAPKPTLNKVKAYWIEDIGRADCKDMRNKLTSVQKMLSQEDPDLVLIHQILNPSLTRLLANQKPSIQFIHDFKIICPDGRKTLKRYAKICPFPLSYSCQARAYQFRCMPRNPFVGLPLIFNSKKIVRLHRQRSFIAVASEFMKSILLYNGFKESRVAVIPIFTDIPKLNKTLSHQHEPSLLAIGRIVPEKGMDYLLRAFANIKHKMNLTVVGNGPALSELKSLSQKLGIHSRVTFTGWLSHNELNRFYQRCALVVVPSIWPEPFGMVGIEAMSYEKPVVAFDVGGISEWLTNGRNGFLVPPGDEKKLADKIKLPSSSKLNSEVP